MPVFDPDEVLLKLDLKQKVALLTGQYRHPRPIPSRHDFVVVNSGAVVYVFALRLGLLAHDTSARVWRARNPS